MIILKIHINGIISIPSKGNTVITINMNAVTRTPLKLVKIKPGNIQLSRGYSLIKCIKPARCTRLVSVSDPSTFPSLEKFSKALVSDVSDQYY